MMEVLDRSAGINGTALAQPAEPTDAEAPDPAQLPLAPGYELDPAHPIGDIAPTPDPFADRDD
jgi:hypothetical protein